jgi:hypothetical protein
MSADNGIYVLYTEAEKGPEYRVAYAGAIQNIYGQFNDETGHYDGDNVSLQSTFKEAPVYYSLNEALDAAEKMVYDYDELEMDLEDGVCVISDFKDRGFLFE